jgi:hypothetical protein
MACPRVRGQTLDADRAATPTAPAVASRIHAGQRGFGFGERNLCSRGEFATDLAVGGEFRLPARHGGDDGALVDVLELLTPEPAILEQLRSQNGELCGVEALHVDDGYLMDHDWISSAGDGRIAGRDNLWAASRRGQLARC